MKKENNEKREKLKKYYIINKKNSGLRIKKRLKRGNSKFLIVLMLRLLCHL